MTRPDRSRSRPTDETRTRPCGQRGRSPDAGSAALVEAIIAVAERLRLRVVAEGVETPEHAAYFARWPHVLQQGYLHGLPEPAAAVLARWLADECPGGAANGAR